MSLLWLLLSKTVGSAIVPVQMIEGLMYDICKNPDKMIPEAFLAFPTFMRRASQVTKAGVSANS